MKQKKLKQKRVGAGPGYQKKRPLRRQSVGGEYSKISKEKEKSSLQVRALSTKKKNHNKKKRKEEGKKEGRRISG